MTIETDHKWEHVDWHSIQAKVDAMSEEEQDTRIEEIYTIPSAELTDDDMAEFFGIMFGF